MTAPNHPGFLLAVEGIDGAGKSTVIQRLLEHCASVRIEAVASKEPTDGPWGKRLRESGQTGRLTLEEELDFFLRDRTEHVSQFIRPSLAEGKIVILDRYYLSTAAYQGARGADPLKILAENEAIAPIPDLVLLLDAPPGTSVNRVRNRGDVPNEFEREEALEKARQIFLSIQRPWIFRIDANRSADVVAGECVKAFESAFETRKRK